MSVAMVGIRPEEWDQLELPDGYRAEIIAGELVVSASPFAWHGAVQAALSELFRRAVPRGMVVMTDVEWRFPERGLLAGAPRPDLLVAAIDGLEFDQHLTAPPLLAVEILSGSDFHLLERSGRPRIVAKREDYWRHGLLHYLEVSMVDGEILAERYEPGADSLQRVATATGEEQLVAERPFPYRIVPAALLPRG